MEDYGGSDDNYCSYDYEDEDDYEHSIELQDPEVETVFITSSKVRIYYE